MNDHALLNGHWTQIYANDNGIDNLEETIGLGTITEMDNGKFFVRTTSGQIVLEGSYTIDSAASPTQINWTDSVGEDAGKTFLSVYVLTPTTFEFCAADAGMARPTSIKPQKGHTIRKFTKLEQSNSHTQP